MSFVPRFFYSVNSPHGTAGNKYGLFMTTQMKSATRIFSEFVNHVHSTLRLPLHSIKNLFPDKPSCLLEYHHLNKGKTKALEIRFDDYGITLSCLFDKNGLCEFSSLFLDSLEDIGKYICFLNESYSYNAQCNGWSLTKGHIRLEGSKDDVAFICFP